MTLHRHIVVTPLVASLLVGGLACNRGKETAPVTEQRNPLAGVYTHLDNSGGVFGYVKVEQRGERLHAFSRVHPAQPWANEVELQLLGSDRLKELLGESWRAAEAIGAEAAASPEIIQVEVVILKVRKGTKFGGVVCHTGYVGSFPWGVRELHPQ